MGEARGAPRFKIGGMAVIYDTGEAFWTAPVIDASATGLFLETAHDLPVGSWVTLHPEHPEEDDRLPFEIKAKVVRVNDYDPDEHIEGAHGVALQMVGLTQQETEALHRYLEEHGVAVRRDA